MKFETLERQVFFDIEISGSPVGRVVIQLFESKAPIACENFYKLGPKYEGTYFHRVIKNFMIQGGDIVYAQASKYNYINVGAGLHPDGVSFKDENLEQSLDEPFFLCMANSGHNSNGSQFFITTASASHLSGKHTVFGKVKFGKSVIRGIERVRTTPENVPLEDELPVIVKFGEWNEGDPVPIMNACYDQIAGDIYEEYPDDDEHIQKDSSRSVYDASLIIKESGAALIKTGDFKNAIFKFKKCLRYIMEYIPDEDQEPEYFSKFADLKKKVYLNLSLSCLKIKDYMKCVDYCTFLLDMNLSAPERSKTLYRLGQAMISVRKYKEAVTILSKAGENSDDLAIKRELVRAEGLLQKQKDAEKAKYSKFFM
ncbi:hypothetical protein METBIDRAFT_30313 [Metschnikowia bicuspidata var. bicuspidata NRRL YB-4993]|uniref:peptidylprolyl isomerase n=1 Tax=Metschnikowia bicuspidata var. bicuspidata NRRL YB-4993 TaxID=869754 RepID=A0A1A0HIW5_9ASCO|nr:hypothetical protein METBIDRAFT_30313 [Metschnikowia bicuspidata var. bicuspidata NRRL YB-4993]OBA23955.1 hypothetical protein METBIDRAFT_30313 [Metschnikowia bicuspidata var. bicuspidata NRRL YB-4993]